MQTGRGEIHRLSRDDTVSFEKRVVRNMPLLTGKSDLNGGFQTF